MFPLAHMYLVSVSVKGFDNARVYFHVHMLSVPN